MRILVLAVLAAAPLGSAAIPGASAGTAAPAWSAPSSVAGALLLAQAPGGGTSQGQHPRGPHLDNTTDGPAPHLPAGSRNRADGGGAPAHLDNTTDGPTPHRPGAAPSTAGGTGPAAHLDNQPGDGPTPHRPGRGTP